MNPVKTPSNGIVDIQYIISYLRHEGSGIIQRPPKYLPGKLAFCRIIEDDFSKFNRYAFHLRCLSSAPFFSREVEALLEAFTLRCLGLAVKATANFAP